MTMTSTALEGGFAEPVHDAQAVFRKLMDAMARPGTIHSLETSAQAPMGLSPAQSAILLCLAEPDTPVWLSSALRSENTESWIRFHSNVPLTRSTGAASFAFLGLGDPLPEFCGFSVGTQDYPDRSTTIIVELPSLTGGTSLTARGPGVDGEISIASDGLPADFLKRWATNRALYPRGVDLILTCGKSILCLPRSAQLTSREA